MKLAIGLVMCILGVVFGLWAGVWWALIGGIIQVVHGFQASPVEAVDIAYGAARIFFAGVIGGVSALVLVAPGVAILQDA